MKFKIFLAVTLNKKQKVTEMILVIYFIQLNIFRCCHFNMSSIENVRYFNPYFILCLKLSVSFTLTAYFSLD